MEDDLQFFLPILENTHYLILNIPQFQYLTLHLNFEAYKNQNDILDH